MNPDLENNLIRLRRISNDVYRNTLSDQDRKWLSQAIFKIYQGIDPYLVFEIQAGRGQRRENTHARHTVDLAMHLISGLRDQESGAGKTLSEAIEIAANQFGLEIETLARYWYDKDNKAMQSIFRGHDTYD